MRLYWTTFSPRDLTGAFLRQEHVAGPRHGLDVPPHSSDINVRDSTLFLRCLMAPGLQRILRCVSRQILDQCCITVIIQWLVVM